MEKKVLIIEDDYLDYIKIQIKLIPDGLLGGFPFKRKGDKRKKKERFLQEANIKDSTMLPEECLTMEERDFIKLLRTHDSINRVQDRVKQIIEEHYNELRLITCDLQICGLDQGGNILIEYLRKKEGQDKITIPGKPWFMQEIPIIVTTKLEGQEPLESMHRGGKNCISIKKSDVLDNAHAANVFRNIVDREVSRFDELFEKKSRERNYKVALSFTGCNGREKHREFVEEIAHVFYEKFGKDKVFYDFDKLKSGDTVRLGKNDFTKLYADQCEYVVVCLSEDYASKDSPWTKKEWEGIRQRISKMPMCVVFVCIGDRVEESKVKSALKCDPGLWISANGCRKEYYRMLDGSSPNLKELIKAIEPTGSVNISKDVKNLLSLFYHEYKNIIDSIENDVIYPIVRHIERVEKGEK